VGEFHALNANGLPLKDGDVPALDALQTGDLIINGVTINPSLAKNDTVSPRTNAAGSAIAIAAAINEQTKLTGVSAVPNKNVMNGTTVDIETTGGLVGSAVINGWKTPDVTTVQSNTRETRAAMVAAVNSITDKTGVKAIDTGDDTLGIKLEAADGRNIEVRVSGELIDATTDPVTNYVGLRPGIQASTYSLEAKVDGKVELTQQDGKDISRARILAGEYTQNVSKQITAPLSKTIAAGETIPFLNEGDLKINGIAIPASTAENDLLSATTNTGKPGASAIAIAAAINSQSSLTGVQAKAVGGVITGTALATPVPDPLAAEPTDADFYVNGKTITINFGAAPSYSVDGDEPILFDFDPIPDSYKESGTRMEFLSAALSQALGGEKIDVSVSGNNLSFNSVDGRNLSVAFVTGSSGALTEADFGLTGFAATSAEVTAGNVATQYGRVELAAVSPSFEDPALYGSSPVLLPFSGGPGHPPHDSFTLETGANGTSGNFEKLGFTAGTFGGEVKDADLKMLPPQTGRLYFQVGASANQTITIDFADFGKNGPITNKITSDVDDKVKTIKIDTSASATAVLASLDEAMDKVNATRATMGAVMNRLQYTMDTLTNVSTNSEASRSQIQDADYASASTELAKTQIMQQAATAVLAQANMSQQTVLKLLQG
jgi:flagellin